MRNVVLMVDDNVDLRDIFADLLAKTSLQVRTFGSVKEAQIFLINPANREQVCAIVSDLMMSPMDGLEFLSYLKKNPATADIDFFLFTAADVSVFKPFLLPFKLKGIIQKPINRKDFVTTFANLVMPDLEAKPINKIAA